MSLRIICVFVFWLTSCRAQQSVPDKSVPKPEEKKMVIEELKDLVQVTVAKKTSYNFLLLLPVDLSDAFESDSLNPDSIFVIENIGKEIKSGIEFYEGALLAVDSLRKSGTEIKLRVTDLPVNDSSQISELSKMGFDKYDAVVSMLRGKPLKVLSDLLSGKRTLLICAAPNSFSSTEKNKNSFCLQPSSLAQCRVMGDYISRSFKNDNFVLVSSSSEKEKERISAFVHGIEKNIPAAEIKKINFISGGKDNFTKTLSSSSTNTIVIPSTDEDFVTNVFAAIDSALEIFQFRVVGLPVWQHFESLDPQVMEKFNTTIFTPDYILFSSAQAIKFREKFRELFRTEPTDAAYLAMDAFMFTKNILDENNSDKSEIDFTGLRTSYHFLKSNYEGGIENLYINILKLEDFRYVKVNKAN